mgnify:CR=1 FL=1
MADVLVDTDVFIDHLRGAVELKPGRNRLHYSVVTRAELFAGNSATGAIASADAALTQDAFNQTITQGANIQFNSVTMNVAGDDWSDEHNLG